MLPSWSRDQIGRPSRCAGRAGWVYLACGLLVARPGEEVPMAGVQDSKMRAAVRKLLSLKRWQESSDRAVAAAARCSKNLVAEVRRQMIAAGLAPARERQDGETGVHAGWAGYRPGTAARGGYVYDESGRAVR